MFDYILKAEEKHIFSMTFIELVISDLLEKISVKKKPDWLLLIVIFRQLTFCVPKRIA